MLPIVLEALMGEGAIAAEGAAIEGSMARATKGTGKLKEGLNQAGKALWDFEKDAIQAFAKQQTLEAQLASNMGGDIGRAHLLSTTLSNFAINTPFNQEETYGAGKQLLRHGFQSNEVGNELNSLKDIAAGSGTSIADLANVYGKVKEEGALSLTTLAKLEDKNIPIVETLKNQFHATRDEVLALVEAGKIGFPQLQNAFKDMAYEGGAFYKAVEIQNDTVDGKYQHFQENLEVIKSKFGAIQEKVLSFGLDVGNGVLDFFSGHKNPTDAEKASITQQSDYKKFLESGDTKGQQNLRNSLLDRYYSLKETLERGSRLAKSGNDYSPEMRQSIWGEMKEITKRLAGFSAYEKTFNENKKLLPPDLKKEKSGAESKNYSGSPQIIVYGGIAPNMIIQSVDGSIPTKDMKDKVGKAFLELINDVNQRTK